MIKVISFTICPFVQRITALLAAKEIPFEVEYISLRDKPDWFLKISPNGQVPVLITENNTALFESDAIAEYLEEAYPPLEQNVSNEQKALDRAWSYLATKHYLTQCSTMRSQDESTYQERFTKLDNMFAKVEGQLTDFRYFKSDQLSMIDIAWLPILHRANIIEQNTCHDMLAKWPNVKRWQQALLNTNLAAQSVANDFEQTFTNFYLSNETYLGNNANCDVSAQKHCAQQDCC